MKKSKNFQRKTLELNQFEEFKESLGDEESDINFAIEEMYENQKVVSGEWKPAKKPDFFAFSNYNADIEIRLETIDNLRPLKTENSRWCWLSDWMFDCTESTSDEGWLYSSKAEPNSFKHKKSKNCNFRRRRLLRARFLDKTDKFDEHETVYKVLKKIITGMIKMHGHEGIKKERKIIDLKEFVEYYLDLYNMIKLTLFEKDIFMMLSDTVKPQKRELEAKEIIKELKNIKTIGFEAENVLENLENLVNRLITYRANFKNDSLLPLNLIEFLVEFAEEKQKKTGETFLETIAKLFRVGNKDLTKDKLDFNPLKDIILMLEQISEKLDKMSESSFEFRAIEDLSKSLYVKFQKYTTHFYDIENNSLIGSIKDCFRIVILNAEIMKKTKQKLPSNPKIFIPTTISKSFKDYYKLKRIQFPLKMADFIVEDWEDFQSHLKKIISDEMNHYIPQITFPKVFKNQGQKTIPFLLSEYVFESNEFYSEVPPSNFIQPEVCASFQLYDYVKKFSTSAKTKEQIPYLNSFPLVFIRYKEYYESIMTDFLDEEFTRLKKNLIKIKREKRDCTNIKTVNGLFPSTIEFLKHLEELKDKYFESLKTFVLSEDFREKSIKFFIFEIGKYLDIAISTIFKTDQLKKSATESFLKSERKFLGIDNARSVTTRSSIVEHLQLSAPVTKIEQMYKENTENIKQKLSTITLKLSIFYNNMFALMEKKDKFKTELENEIQKLKNAKKISKISFKWEMKKVYESCDSLLEIISLRLSLLDFSRLIQLLFTKKNPQDDEVNDELQLFVSKTAELKENSSIEIFHILLENTRSIFYRLTEWALLSSDRTYNKNHSEKLRKCFKHFCFLINGFLPEEQRKETDEFAEPVLKLLDLMSLTDSELLSVYRGVREKGAIKEDFVANRAHVTKGSEKVIEQQELNLVSFLDMSMEDNEEQKCEKEGGMVILNKTEKPKIIKRVLQVISRRRTNLCRKFASENGQKTPLLRQEDDESESSEDYSSSKEEEKSEESTSDVSEDKEGFKQERNRDGDGFEADEKSSDNLEKTGRTRKRRKKFFGK